MTIRANSIVKGRSIISKVRDNASARAWDWDTAFELTTAGAVLASWSNADVLKFSIDKDGGMIQVSGAFNGFYGVTPVAQASKISDPTGGATTDAEARTAIDAIIDVLEGIGISAAV